MWSMAWVACGLCVAAWTGVWFLDASIAENAQAHTQNKQSADQKLSLDAVAARTRALIQDTADARTELAALSNTDVLAAAKLIESVGVPAGVTVRVSDAAAEHPATVAGAGDHPLHAIGFTVESDGSFAALMRVVALLHTLPLPTSVEQLDLARAPDDGNGKTVRWHLSARIRLLTSADISS